MSNRLLIAAVSSPTMIYSTSWRTLIILRAGQG